MEIRYMKRLNENGQEERFYPITHAKAIVGLSDVPEVSGNDLISTEAASEIVGDAPEIDPAIIDLVNSLTAEDVGAVGWKNSYHIADVVTWASSQNNPTSGYATPETVNIPVSGYFLLELSVGADNAWKVVTATTISGVINHGTRFVGIYANGEWRGWTQFSNSSEYLPLTGGTLSGEHLYTGNGYGLLQTRSNQVLLGSLKTPNDSNSDGPRLQIINDTDFSKSLNLLNVVSGNWSGYRIFGEYNKPFGVYTGNGDTTERIINTGGISNVLFVKRSQYMGIVGPLGAWGIHNGGTGFSIPQSEVSFADGVLTIKSTNSAINNAGSTYFWQVL